MKTGKLGKLLITVLVIVVIVLAVAGVLSSMMTEKTLSPDFSAELDGLENALYLKSGNGFAAANEVMSRIYNENGDTLCSVTRSIPDPIMVCKDGHAAVWSKDGMELCLLHSDGSSKILSFDSEIISADINKNGWTAVLTGETGYKGVVNVYRENGENAYRVYLGSGYPVDTDINSDCSNVAILTLTGEGSHVLIYSLNSEKILYQWDGDGLSCFELRYLANGRILLLGSDAAVFLSGEGRELGRYSYAEEQITCCDTGNERFVILALTRYKAGNTGSVVVLNTDGSIVQSCEINGDVYGINATAKYIAVQYQDRIELYDENLQEYCVMNDTAGIQAAFVRTDGSVLIVSGGGAGIYEP